ncbi:nickel pincer cofactor biosynthesis protein LarC [Pseudogracilibacillus auburnensis]|uniref:nickel pincer cofactor biosynthesis protein LarC n=1 Tax=Pseudogracilibacillus auburnensis TaxID=1494959 RepID=UPI001A978193|nr:nickel pincer cofactor biosynthesis protein LarC [Pseudogracilibacillus auburnensis]MBO1005946.1 nickel pincer cofactor biosynthesis protein LarC [Pseudogracilibacillus auburnensis]
MKLLYIDCFSGISGDMMVGALIDAGASVEHIEQELKKLNVSGYKIETKRVMKEGISSVKFDVILDEDSHDHEQSHNHSHEHYHGGHEHGEDHSHGHHHDHNHSHGPGDEHHHHDHHHHSCYADIVKLIDESNLAPGVKKRSKEIFAPIAQSEAKIHNMSIEDVHFHEVGAVDSIVDIVATAIALEQLEVEKIVTSHVPLGSGKIRISHGIYPVPAPATLDIMKNVPIAPTDLKFEVTTPTGAGIVVSQTDSFGTMPAMKVTSIGYGAGTKNIPGRPNVLRVMLGESIDDDEANSNFETITVLECQLDDMTGEAFGFVMDRLIEAGALDVYFTPVFMKKNRPGTLITVLASTEKAEILEDVLLRETNTLGVRKSRWDRSILERNIVTVNTKYGPIKLKQAIKKGKVIREVPEFEDVKEAALQHHVSFQDVYESALRARN